MRLSAACFSTAVSLSLALGASNALAQTPNQPPPTGTPNQPPPAGTPPALTPAQPGADPNAAPSGGAAPAPAPAPKADEDEDKDLKRIAIYLFPLGIIIGRYSIGGEYMLARHHGISLNPYFTNVPVEVNGVEVSKFSGFGAELGYKFYTGSKGPNGFFIGPSFLFSSFTASGTGAFANAPEKSFTAIGGALDLGGQGVIGPGIIIGGGFGLQYTKNSEDVFTNTDDFNIASIIIAGGGVRPRFLFNLGFAF